MVRKCLAEMYERKYRCRSVPRSTSAVQVVPGVCLWDILRDRSSE